MFPTLVTLVKLDLSKNELKELPDNFGELSRLKHLDLYKNELQYLPLSFGKLQALKWLDLKDNPLKSVIKETAGQCLYSKQCQDCAKNIVQFYSDLELDVQIERENRQKQSEKDRLTREMAAQKLKAQEAKSKKKDKQKQKLNGVVQPQLPAVKVKNNLRRQTKTTKKQKPVSYMWQIMKLLLLLISTITVVLFVLTSLKFELTKCIDVQVAKMWSAFVNYLPPDYQKFGIYFENFMGNFHRWTGKTAITLYYWFRNNEYLQFVQAKVKNISMSIM